MDNKNTGRTFWDFLSEQKIVLYLFLTILVVGSLSLVYLMLKNNNVQSSIISVKSKEDSIIYIYKKDTLNIKPTKKLKTVEKIYIVDTSHKHVINVSSSNQSGGITANNVVIGKTSRTLTQLDKESLLTLNKDQEIDVIVVDGDPEAFQYANETLNFLISSGYKNVEGLTKIMFAKPVTGKYITKKGEKMEIFIGSIKNE